MFWERSQMQGATGIDTDTRLTTIVAKPMGRYPQNKPESLFTALNTPLYTVYRKTFPMARRTKTTTLRTKMTVPRRGSHPAL
jgi:hypothetical protein